MCNFFSFVTDETGKKYFFNWEQRQKDFDGADSHDHICQFYKLDKARCSCYEFNPLTKDFEVDTTGEVDDRVRAEKWAKKLDFANIIPALVIKPIVNPFDLPKRRANAANKSLLKEWASVWASVWDSVRDSVRASVGASVGASVWDSVRASVWDSMWDSVRASVWDSVRASVGASVGASVWDSVRDSVWDSVRASVWAYVGSFFNIEYKIDISPAIKLWESGIAPSFDGKTWRLHSGKNAGIIYEISDEELRK